MATFEAEMMAFPFFGEMFPRIRKIDVPDEELTGESVNDLERIFYWGQNDFQPRDCPSLSVGDVVRYGKKRFLVAALGFKELEEGEEGGFLRGYGFPQGGS